MNSQNRQANPDDIDIMDIWNAVIGNLKSLILFSGLIGAIVFVGLSAVNPQYSSKAKILIENERSAFKQPKGGQNQQGSGAVSKETVKSQAQVIQSNDLARKVATRLKLNEKPEFNSALGGNSLISKIMSLFGLNGDANLPESERVMEIYYKRLTVFPLKDSHVINVEFRAQDPQLAVNLANELSNTYIDFLKTAGVTQNKDAQKWLGQEIGQLRADVEVAEEKAAILRASTGTMRGRDNVTLNVQQLGEINSRLSLAKAQKSEAVARAKIIREMLRQGSIDSSPDVLKSRLIQRLNEQRVRVERQIAELSATLLARHPRMKQLRSELSGLQRQIRREAVKLVKGLENEAKIAGAKEASLLTSIQNVRQKTVGQSGAQAKLRVLEREAKSKRELYESYLSRLSDASARQRGIAVPIIARIVQKATVSNIPVFPKKLPFTILAIVASLFLGLMWIITRELLRGARSKSMSTGSSSPIAPPVAMVPRTNATGAAHASAAAAQLAPNIPSPAQSPSLSPTAPPSPAMSPPLSAEQMGSADTVKTTPIINSAAKSGAAKSGAAFDNGSLMAITDFINSGAKSGVAKSGAASDNGSLMAIADRLVNGAQSHTEHGYRTLIANKNTTADGAEQAIELACALDRSGKSVVLIDWEAGKDSVVEKMGCKSTPGILDLIEGRVGFQDVLQSAKGSGIHIISAGNSEIEIDPDTEKSQIEVILDALDETYDHIVAYGSYDRAQELFQITEGRFDAGVTICDSNSLPNAVGGTDSFLGYTVEGIDIQHYVPKTEIVHRNGGVSA